jgi:ribosomal protein S18 acetylase RimI-like enzyme
MTVEVFKSDASHPSAVAIRAMEIDDLAAVYHLGETLFTSDLYPYLYRTWDQWEVIGLYNTDAEYCLVAEINETLAGFVLGTVINKASWTYGYIIWLGVSPAVQRQGVADKLVDRIVERMIEDGARFMLVDTDPENVPAVKFFTRKGFGNVRKHVFLSMNLSKHEYYGRLIAYEREKAERSVWQRSRRR